MKVGMAVPLAHDPPPRYGAIRELARLIEQRDLDSVWVFDHLMFRRPEQPTAGGWEAWTMLSALAEATQRVELGMLVAAAPFRNPAVFAKMNCSSTKDNDAVGCLAGHLLAAELNVANGANTCINPTIASANSFLTNIGYTGPSGTYVLNKTQRTIVIALKNSLDKYNNGLGC